jgi:hypothetical protein
MTIRHATNTRIAPTLKRSRFFSHTPAPFDTEYMEPAIMSDRPVPFPECIRMLATAMMPDRNQMMRMMVLMVW